MRLRLFLWVVLTLLAFAANSVLCRLALRDAQMDAAAFTMIRLLSGASVLGGLTWLAAIHSQARAYRTARFNVTLRWLVQPKAWLSALALFVYAACFSLAYLNLTTATGALLLFGSVQVAMLSYGFWHGERLNRQQTIGLLMALAGLIYLLLPGISAPPLSSAVLMLISGLAWAIYSIRGAKQRDPLGVSAVNFWQALALSLLLMPWLTWQSSPAGWWYAIASGALASGLGYALWYRVINELTTTSASAVQLSVPAFAALGGIVFLAEPLSLRVAIATVAILGGIVFVSLKK